MAAPASSPRYSIVVPAFNEEDRIGACLRSLARQHTDASYEVILVDNNSTDATVRVAGTVTGELNLRIIHEPRQGRGAARRTGFGEASGTIVFSADADTAYPARWMQTLLNALADERVVAAATTARIDDLAWWQNLVFNVGQPAVMGCYRLVRGHHCLSGFSFAIRRDVYARSGGFDPELNAEEDDDLSRRVAPFGAIRLVLRPVTFSGRRFKDGLLRGLFAYVRMSWEYRSRRTSAYLNDVR